VIEGDKGISEDSRGTIHIALKNMVFYKWRGTPASLASLFQDDNKVSLIHVSDSFVTKELETSLCPNLKQLENVWGNHNFVLIG